MTLTSHVNQPRTWGQDLDDRVVPEQGLVQPQLLLQEQVRDRRRLVVGQLHRSGVRRGGDWQQPGRHNEVRLRLKQPAAAVQDQPEGLDLQTRGAGLLLVIQCK